ncbi:MAG: hypothetical protein WDO15_14380 [Bacteroidota bacterium]
MKRKKYVTAYIATALLPLGGFMLMPFGSAFAQYNLGVTMRTTSHDILRLWNCINGNLPDPWTFE